MLPPPAFVLPEWVWAPAAAAAVGAAFVINRRLIGFLPDDVPGPGRKAHRARTPLAGIALAPLAIAALLLADRWLLAAAALLAAVTGFLDDRCKERQRDFDWRGKGLLLLLAAVLAALEVTPDPLATPGRCLLAIVLVFALTNATNFLDNTDGVAASLAAVSLLLLGGGNGAFAAIGWAALGFLPWNWPRPWLFLGDAGALLLGVCLGAAAAAQLPRPDAALLPVAVQLLDFVQVIGARLWLGYAPWIGDRRHLPHIAQNLGLPRLLVAPLLSAAALLLGGLTPWW